MDMGASVIARLKNKAKETGKPFQTFPIASAAFLPGGVPAAVGIIPLRGKPGSQRRPVHIYADKL